MTAIGMYSLYGVAINQPSSNTYLPVRACEQGNVIGLVSIYIGDCGSTLYVGLTHVVSPINTKFKPFLLPTQAGMPYTNTHKHRTSYFKSTLTFLVPAKL